MFALVFRRRYSMAHRLIAGESPKCAVPHGHNEIVTVRLEARHPSRLDGEVNMVEVFERAKATWHSWIDNHVDHALQLSDRDALIGFFAQHEPERMGRLLICPGDPTTEMLAACFMAKLNSFLAAAGGRLRCVEVAIEETPTNTVVLTGEASEVLPARSCGDLLPWWHRADMSINDLVPVRPGAGTLPVHAAAPPGIALS